MSVVKKVFFSAAVAIISVGAGFALDHFLPQPRHRDVRSGGLTNGSPTNGGPTNGSPTTDGPTNGGPTNGGPASNAPPPKLPNPYPWLQVTSGSDLITFSNDSISFGIRAPFAGSQMQSSWTAHSAVVCATIATNVGLRNASGSIFAMYAITQHPKDRKAEKWWELDIELLGRNPGAIWVNTYTAGVPDVVKQPDGTRFIPLPANTLHTDEHRYCLDWDTAHASWAVDGVEVARRTLNRSWSTQALRLFFSYWAGNDQKPGLAQWAGGNGVQDDLLAVVKDILYEVRA